jgi:subtilisin-like proprotein convertase family protein
MKIKLTAVTIVFLAWATIAPAQILVTNDFLYSANIAVPDGNPNGLALTTSLSGLSGSIADVTVTLDITGGNNSDLYSYLTGPNGGFAILLNRVGMGSANPYGYEDTGFNITLSDSATYNVHNYQSAGGGYTLNGSGQLTGLWAPDGRNIDPQSAPSSFDSAPTTTTFDSFLGTNPDGMWTFFIADLSGGAQSTVSSWSVDIVTDTPEPGTRFMLGLGGALLLFVRFKKS